MSEVVIQERPVCPKRLNQAQALGLPEAWAQIVARRAVPEGDALLPILEPRLGYLTSPDGLPDVQRATERLCRALAHGEVIALETDHDCDGQTSHAVLHEALTRCFGHPQDKVCSFIGHRLKEGYGLSEALATRIVAHEPKPTLVITADNGSTDEPRIARLKAAGIDTIVTDHHELPLSGPPPSAWAVVNPTRADSTYGDPCVAGCMVAWLLMAATRQALEAAGRTLPSLAPLLDFVAVGTVADCVSMARSPNNRAVVSYGLRLLAQRKRPCWKASLPPGEAINEETLGFAIGPLLNSDGRLATALRSVSFLLATTDEEAQAWLSCLQEANTERKSIQKQITQRAMQQAQQAVRSGAHSLCLYMPEGHVGIQGISASRVKDAWGRPTIICSDKPGAPELITGSARGIDGLHFKEILERIHQKHPEVLVSFGGHRAAAGLTFRKEHQHTLVAAFEAEVRATGVSVGVVLPSDGLLQASLCSLAALDSMDKHLMPFGREFERPSYTLEGVIQQWSWMGDGTHARMRLTTSWGAVEGVWFGARQSEHDPAPCAIGDRVRGVVSVRLNVFQAQRRAQLQVLALYPIPKQGDAPMRPHHPLGDLP